MNKLAKAILLLLVSLVIGQVVSFVAAKIGFSLPAYAPAPVVFIIAWSLSKG